MSSPAKVSKFAEANREYSYQSVHVLHQQRVHRVHLIGRNVDRLWLHRGVQELVCMEEELGLVHIRNWQPVSTIVGHGRVADLRRTKRSSAVSLPKRTRSEASSKRSPLQRRHPTRSARASWLSRRGSSLRWSQRRSRRCRTFRVPYNMREMCGDGNDEREAYRMAGWI